MEQSKIKNYVKGIEKVLATDLNTIDSESPYNQLAKMYVKEVNKYFRAIAKENNWSLITKGHPFCSYSCFFKNGEKFIYVSLSDFRFWDWKEVLYRTTRSEMDYTGGGNNYCDITEIEDALIKLFERGF